MGNTVVGSLLERARAGQEIARAETTALRTQLPFRYLRQQSHLTAPANDYSLAEKAITSAPGIAARLLKRYGITEVELAKRLGVSTEDVRTALETATPLVLLDLEDGVPPPLVKDARANAVRLFREADWGSSLRFFRPASLTEERCAEDITEVLMRSAEGIPPDRYPIDSANVFDFAPLNDSGPKIPPNRPLEHLQHKRKQGASQRRIPAAF